MLRQSSPIAVEGSRHSLSFYDFVAAALILAPQLMMRVE